MILMNGMSAADRLMIVRALLESAKDSMKHSDFEAAKKQVVLAAELTYSFDAAPSDARSDSDGME